MACVYTSRVTNIQARYIVWFQIKNAITMHNPIPRWIEMDNTIGE